MSIQDSDINIELIMQEIKAGIKEKGYTNDLLSFNDIVIDTSLIKLHLMKRYIQLTILGMFKHIESLTAQELHCFSKK